MFQRIIIILGCLLASSPAFAGFKEGKAAYDRKDWTAAITELRPLAEAGDDRAMILLANMYSEGFGVIRSYKEALSLYRTAAAKNNTDAMLALGGMYVSGTGTRQHLNTAKEWFLRAAQLGEQQGAFFYATILFQGNRSPTDEVAPDIYSAYKWFKIASASKQSAKMAETAQQITALIAEKKLTPAEVEKADKETAGWKPVEAASLGPLPPEPVFTGAPPPVSPDTPPAPAPVTAPPQK